MPRRGRRRKKSHTHVADEEVAQSAASALNTEGKRVPKSLVTRRGKTAPEVGELVHDLRQLLLPYTALNFQDDPKNRKLTLQQYSTSLALPMGITHIFAFSQSNPAGGENGSPSNLLNLRLGRTPEGPTMYFRVHRFSLAKHVKALQKRPVALTNSLTCNPPIVVTNNFGDQKADPHLKLMRITFQNIFPAINVSQVKLKDCRRVVMFNRIEKDGEDTVEVRHYAIKASPTGINRRVRRLVQSKLPNLNKVNDIADYLEGNALVSDAPSDSEPEDDNNVVQLAGRYTGKGNMKSHKSALKLVELGPRLTLELYKVEKNLGGGDVLYHGFVQKTPEEAAELKARKQKEVDLKNERRSIQERNVEQKRKVADEKREAKKQRREQQQADAMAALRTAQEEDEESSDGVEESSSEDDEE